jgi:hypothetical protein
MNVISRQYLKAPNLGEEKAKQNQQPAKPSGRPSPAPDSNPPLPRSR